MPFLQPVVEASWSRVPASAWVWLMVALLAQGLYQPWRLPPEAVAQPLPPAPSEASLQVLALGEPRVLARVLLAGLFSYDTQPGVSLGYREFDYGRVTAWLARMLTLDPSGQGPLLAAARLYAEVGDPARQRQMLAFIRDEYPKDPARRWPWMAHAVFIARHRLQDLPLALDLASELARHAPPDAPAFTRQMHWFVLEAMGETEAVKVLLGALLESELLTDPAEQAFLSWRLREMEQADEPSSAPNGD